MCSWMICALAMSSRAIPAASVTFAGQPPVEEAMLATQRGTAVPQRWLAASFTDQANVQQQLISETMRLNFDNWFADNNVQLVANASFTR